jgi:hypothetical protein
MSKKIKYLLLFFSLPLLLNTPAIAANNENIGNLQQLENTIDRAGEETAPAPAATNNANANSNSNQIGNTAERVGQQLKQRLQDKGREYISQYLQNDDGILGQIFKYFQSTKESIEAYFDKITIPDLKTIIESGEAAKGPGAEVAKGLENQSKGSYAIEQDHIQKVTRDLIQQSTEESTTSEDAQIRTRKLLVQTEDNVKSSADLGQESSESDVSQQILQNLSQQESVNAQLLGTLIVQNNEAKIDRSNQILLDLQQAEHNQVESIARRREKSGISAESQQGWGSLTNPVYIYTEAEDE